MVGRAKVTNGALASVPRTVRRGSSFTLHLLTDTTMPDTAAQETLAITGMTCDHCVRAVRQAIGRVEGAEATSVSIGTATVAYNREDARADVIAAIKSEGYALAG